MFFRRNRLHKALFLLDFFGKIEKRDSLNTSPHAPVPLHTAPGLPPASRCSSQISITAYKTAQTKLHSAMAKEIAPKSKQLASIRLRSSIKLEKLSVNPLY